MSMSGNSPDEDDILSEINMTPLIDVMLVLLIIFMVTSTVSLESGLDVELPTMSEKGSSGSEEKAVLVGLDKNGLITVQGENISEGLLLDSIRKALVSEKTDFVVFEGDRNAFLGKAVAIMDLAKQAGAKRFAIAADTNSTKN